MQSTENVSLADNGDKSLNEWPTLNDVCSYAKKPFPSPSAARNVINNRSRNKSPNEKSGGYDSSKENEVSPQNANGRGARKKSSIKTKWVPVPIVPQPYKKRGFGRHFESNRSFNGDRKNESNEFANGQENGRGGLRGNNRFRGKRGRGYSHNWRPRREETSRGEVENGTTDLTFEAECYYNNAVYYDPFLHNVYASALRDKELKTAIRLQIEYYFSDDNLVKDIFMRRKMDSQGYVPLTLIATFHRVKNLTKNIDTIIESLNDSSKLELVENTKVRPVVDPLKWPLPDTFVGLRTDVPEFFPGQPYVTAIIKGMDNLNFHIDDMNGDTVPQSPDSACLSPDQVIGDFITDGNEKQTSNGLAYYPESITPPEHISSSINFFTESSLDPYATNGCDFFSHTPSPDDHVNGFDYYSKQISNGVLYYAANVDVKNQIPNGVQSFYYASSPDDVLSTGTDNSIEDQKDVLENESPEPGR